MATKRMISRRITESDKMLALAGNDRARFVYAALLPHTDKAGCVNANPYGLKGSVFEGFEYTVADIAGALQALSDVGLIVLYSSGRHQLIAQFVKFEKFNKPHKNEAESDFPRLGDKGTAKVTDVAAATGITGLRDSAATIPRNPPPTPPGNVRVKGKELSGVENSTEFSTGEEGAAPEGATPPEELTPDQIQAIEAQVASLPEGMRHFARTNLMRTAKQRAEAQAYTQALNLYPLESMPDYVRNVEVRGRAQKWRQSRIN
jgi:hypothetical protein